MAVTPETIAVAFGRDLPTILEYEQWAMWINDARLLISARLGDLEELDQDKLDYVVREAVVAHIRHPDDATTVSETLGDASVSKTYRSGRGRVTIFDEWWDLLATEEQGGAFVLDMISTSSVHLAWCSINFGALYCSCGADIAGYPIYELS